MSASGGVRYVTLSITRSGHIGLIQHCIAEEVLGLFNQVMMMETFTLADNSWQGSLRSDNQNPYEIYRTRLVQVGAVSRSRSGDFLRRALRIYSRAFWFFIRFRERTRPPKAKLLLLGHGAGIKSQTILPKHKPACRYYYTIF